jgi:hypothetical protein
MAIDNTVERNKLRSSLFRWMVKHHDEWVQRWNGQKIDWRTSCEELTELGLTDTRGRPATERNARETWLQARKFVAANRKAAAAQPPRAGYPSRIDKEWRPANAPPPAAPLAPAGVPAVWSPGPQNQLLAVRKTAPEEKKPFDPKAQKARLRRIIDERTG